MNSVRSFAHHYFFNMSEDTFCRIAAVLFSLVMFYAFLGLFVAEFNHDEFEALHTAWKMLQGQTIFKDFFQHHHQLFYYIVIPFLYIFGETLTACYIARAATFGICLLLYSLTFYGARRYFSRSVAWITLFFMVGLPMLPCAFQIRPDGLMTLFAMAGVLLFFRFLEHRKEWYLCASGICLALSFLVLQKIVILLFLLGLLALYFLVMRVISFFDLLRYAAYAVLPLAVYALYLTYYGLWKSYITCNVIFTIYQPAAESLSACAGELYAQTVIIRLFFLLGLFFYLRTSYQRYVAYFASGLVVILLTLVRVPCLQYYVLPFPFIAMTAGNAVASLSHKNYAQVLLIVLLHLSQAWLGGGYNLLRYGFVHTERNKAALYMLGNTDKNDYVLDDARHNLFRQDAHFFWFNAGLDTRTESFAALYQKVFGVPYDMYEAIEEKKPKIITATRVDTTHPVIADKYVQVKDFPDLLIRRTST